MSTKFNKVASSWKQEQNDAENLSELAGDMVVPEHVAALVAGPAERTLWATIFARSKSLGLSDIQAFNDAWGAVVASSTKTADGKYQISGSLLPYTAYQPTPNPTSWGLPSKAAGMTSEDKRLAKAATLYAHARGFGGRK
jgi:hypothetical protein